MIYNASANCCGSSAATWLATLARVVADEDRVEMGFVVLLAQTHAALQALDEAVIDDEGREGMMTKTRKIDAAVVEFADVQVIDDGGPKLLVRLGQNNNGEPADVAVVVMAPELAKILSVKLADATFEANWGPLLRISWN
jgi:hypothetical protein